MKKCNWRYSAEFDELLYRTLKDSGYQFNIRLNLGGKSEFPLRLIKIMIIRSKIFFVFQYYISVRGIREIIVDNAGNIINFPDYRVILYWNQSLLYV